MSAGGALPPSGGGVPTCYRHPGRETYVRCQRCERPICPDCMRDASVGFQCPSCVQEGLRDTRQHQAAFGGRRSSDPRLTSIALIVVNAAVWLGILATGGGNGWLARLLAIRPAGTCNTSDHAGYYPGVGEAVCRAEGGAAWVEGVASGAWWQVLTSAFTHIDPIHIGFNMLAVWFLGPQLEAVVGRARFLAIYFGSALTGSAAVMLLSNPAGSTLGASGAVFGMLGALLVLAHKVRANLQQLLMWVGLNFVITFLAPGISWQGHVGGFLGGAALAAAIAYAPKPRRTAIQWGAVVGVTVLALAAVTIRALALA